MYLYCPASPFPVLATISSMANYDDFKHAIQKEVFIHARPDTKIVRSTSNGNAESMPWIMDFRALILQAKWLDRYAEIFWEKYAHSYPFQVGGLESASIPLVAAIVMKSVARGTPINGFFIRKSRKREGLLKQIEGTLTKDPIILVDDLINSGGSFYKQILVLEPFGVPVRDIFAIVAFREPAAYELARTKNITVSWLFTLADFGEKLLPARAPQIPAEHFHIEWKFAAPSPSYEYVVQKSAPVIDENNVYFGTDMGSLYALRQGDGSVLTSFDIGKHPPGKGIFSTAALAHNTIYFGAYDGNVYAIDTQTSARKWKFENADWIGSSPALAPDLGLVFIGLEFGLFRKRGGIAAIDIHTGTLRWSDRTSALTHGSPLYIPEENLVVIGSNDGVIYAYEAKSGTRKWTYQTGGDIKTRPAYDPKRRTVLVPSMDSKLYILSAKDGAPLSAFQTGAGIYSNPLVSDDSVFIASLDKTLYRVDLETGRARWEYTTGGRIFASPVVADGSVWIGSNDGRLYEINPDDGKLHRFHQFSERVINPIAYNATTQRFFVTTVANELFCLRRA